MQQLQQHQQPKMAVIVKRLLTSGGVQNTSLSCEADVTVGDVKQQLLAGRQGQVKLIFCGRVLEDGESLPQLDHGGILELHAIVDDDGTPFTLPLSTTTTPIPMSSAAASSSSSSSSSSSLRAHPLLDAASERAAIAFVAQMQSSTLGEPIADHQIRLLCGLATLLAESRQGGNTTAAPAIPNIVQNPPRVPPEPPLRLVDAYLFVKLVVLYFVFSQGLSAQRTALFIAIVVGYYLYEVGILQFLLKRFIRWHQQLGGAPGQVVVDPQYLQNALLQIISQRFHVPRTPSLLLDAWSFSMALVCSLFPQWRVEAEIMPGEARPQAAPRVPLRAAAPAAQPIMA